MTTNINGIDYERGAEHAGLTCWLSAEFVEIAETTPQPLPAGDYAKDVLIRYMADPDGFRENPSILITDERMRPWPLRNQHRRDSAKRDGGKNEAHKCTTTPVVDQKPANVSGKASPAQVAGWPRWVTPDDNFSRARITALEVTVFPPNHPPRDGARYRADWLQQHNITPAAAATWLRANGHAQAAAEIEVLDEYEPVTERPRKGDRMKHAETGYEVFALKDGSDVACGVEARDRWFTATDDRGGGVYTLRDGGGYRILKRRQPDGKGR